MGNALSLAISKVPDARRQGVTSEAYKHTPQGGTTAVNAAGGTLMMDQGIFICLTF